MAAVECKPKPQESFLLSDEEWETARNSGDYDYVIVGSSFCAFGFIYQALQRNPDNKILIIERGKYISPESFKNLTPQELGEEEKMTEKFSWNFTPHEDGQIQRVRGMNYLLGGRSCYWKAWCPQPREEEMGGWPTEVIDKVKEYFPKAKELLSVRNAKRNPFKQLQQILLEKVKSTGSKIESIKRVEDAPIAIVEKKNR